MSTAIDDLRSMLDERHVKWRTDTSVTNKVEWTIWKSPWFKEVWAKEVDGSISIFNCSMTPAQAIEATLGSDLKAENAKRIYDRCLNRVGQLEAENKKLRELVRIAINYCDTGTCDGCPIQGESGSCPYSDMARELGVEV